MKEIRSAPFFVRLQVSQDAGADRVDVDESLDGSESTSFKRQCLQTLREPGWLASVAVHLGLILLLSIWMLPSLERVAMIVVGEIPNESVEKFETLQFGKIALEIPWESEVENLVEPQTEFRVEEDLSLAADTTARKERIDDFDGKLVAHNLKLPEIDESRFATAELDAATAKAVGVIQEQVAKAGGKSGEVQFSLVWKTISDLDLHVVTPDGERIYFEHRKSRCIGVLDVDRNANENETTRKPVENIRWLKNKPREGRYTAIVHLFQPRGPIQIIDYDLMAKTGDAIELKHDQISEGNRLKVARFIFIPPSFLSAQREERLAWYRELQADEESKASKMFEKIDLDSTNADQELWQIVRQYPHTDAAIKALSLIAGSSTK